jgi:hypothetical protein
MKFYNYRKDRMRSIVATPENIHGVLSQSAGLEHAPDMRAIDMQANVVTYRLDRTARTGYYAIRAGSLISVFRPLLDTHQEGQFVTQINLHENRRILKDHLQPLYLDVQADDTPKDLIARGTAAVIDGSYDTARAEEIRGLIMTANNLAASTDAMKPRHSVLAAPEIFPNQ